MLTLEELLDQLKHVPTLRSICLICTRENRLHMHVWLITWRFAGMVILSFLNFVICVANDFSRPSCRKNTNVLLVNEVDLRTPKVCLVGQRGLILWDYQFEELSFPEVPLGIIWIGLDSVTFLSFSSGLI